MLATVGMDERRIRVVVGLAHKALILVTLGCLAVLAPLNGTRLGAAEPVASVAMAPIEERPESNEKMKVLWLDSKWVAAGQGDSFRLVSEE